MNYQSAEFVGIFHAWRTNKGHRQPNLTERPVPVADGFVALRKKKTFSLLDALVGVGDLINTFHAPWQGR